MCVRSFYYHLQWRRYLQFYPRQNFFALRLAELTHDPRLWMQRIYEFLGVDATFVPSFEHLNAGAYSTLATATRLKLDLHFQEVVSAATALAGRDLKLGQK